MVYTLKDHVLGQAAEGEVDAPVVEWHCAPHYRNTGLHPAIDYYERALAFGLINQVVPRDQLVDAAHVMARRITANAPLAVQATKESVMRGLFLDYEGALKLESELSTQIFQSEDAKEGPKAFAEKRKPVWQGR